MFGETPSDILAELIAHQSADGDAGGGNAGDGQKSDDAGAGGSSGSDDKGSDGQEFNAARAKALIDKLREENKAALAAKKERDDLAARLQAIEDKDKSEGEKAVAQLTRTQAELKAAQLEAESLRTTHRNALIGHAIERAASKANAVDAEVVAQLIDRSSIEIEDDGTVKGADKAVEALLKAKPFLVASGQQSGTVKGTPGTPDGKSGGMSKADLFEQTKKELQQSGMYGRL
jgi:hypothetical protein